MPVLSIISCGMLEDEHMCSRRIAELTLVENSEYFGLQRKLKYRGCLPALVPLDRIQKTLEK
ncbi:MAG: hypothetical protein O8C66_13470 [Candidatus Methanoperedens sp.]|nr:hypothetical protein [Candidatus Methanoperedens sp.]MCZ7371507.1 hypothetical protein [Candidatus Methanoperedens sp.]